MSSATATSPVTNAFAASRLPRFSTLWILLASLAVSGVVVGLVTMAGDAEFNVGLAVFFGAVIFAVANYVISLLVEGSRRAADRLVTTLVVAAFTVAMIPLVSLVYTVVVMGSGRIDWDFFTLSMRNVLGEGGGAAHAIVGTLLMTGLATVISVPIGLLTSIYLVEYGRGRLAQAITFFVDVMTGIPSIVAGLFAFALFELILGPGTRVGLSGAIALTVLMLPVVVRSSEEILRLVPNELREASYALGVPKWLTILKVVIPTSIAGISTGVMLSIARVIGETAPLLIAAGFSNNFNYDLTEGRMQSLPVYVYYSYISQGTDFAPYIERAWAGALTLIAIVMILNLIARLVARIFAPKLGR
ncbi:phosphate ABC transporter permease PstA [uncultured Schumannella sp.]|uniref:phosphate ABC transporter permease PstA n=1 Tax=uncultured Schumannella sp. TaxID=1195956 RepID=UPI0025EEB159|nr:phosphate ABC transporter permease PstA [uncultured Schumannella sp.]